MSPTARTTLHAFDLTVWSEIDAARVGDMDPHKLLDKYDEFVKYLQTIPDAPRRRDDGRMLAETAVRALADLKQCVATAAQNKDALLFRLLPPPG